MEYNPVFEQIFDSKIIRVLRTLFKEKDKQYYLKEISDNSKVPIATTLRILNKLSKFEIIEITKVSRVKLYRFVKNSKVLFLSGLFKEDIQILERFVDQAKFIKGVKRIVLHGKEMPDRANILLIGQDIAAGDVKRLCAEIKEKYNFVISSLSLEEEQYMQMRKMGLYSGIKKVLWES